MAAGDMTFNRQQWVQDLGQRVPLLKKNDFIRDFLPQLPSETVERTRRRLEVKAALFRVAQDGNARPPQESLWTHFPTLPSKIKAASLKRRRSLKTQATTPKRRRSQKTSNDSNDQCGEEYSTPVNEAVIFRRLETIWASIKTAGSKVLGRTANTEFKTDPNHKFKSEESSWNSTFKVDGYDYFPHSEEECLEGVGGLEHELYDGDECEVGDDTDEEYTDGDDDNDEGTDEEYTDEEDEEWVEDTDDAAEDDVQHDVEERDAAYILEAKIKQSDINEYDNACKVIGAASHHLFANPCRRFMYGLTIEDGQAKMWCFTRSAVVASEPFDYLTDADTLIYFVLSIAFSDRAAVGYDPTVKRVSVGGQWQYKYRVAGVWYITVECLSNFRSVRVIGRATRVWKVKRWEDVDKPDAPHFALKDVWLDEDARTESEIQNDIFKNFNRVNPVDMDIDEAHRYFMTILEDEDVTINGSADTTRELPRFGFILLEEPGVVKLQISLWNEAHSSAVIGSVSESRKDTKPVRQRNSKYRPKRHRRILFEEIGQTLNDVLNHKKLFGALVDAVQGLKVLYSAGYVHRDISTGNVLLCGDTGKISDLEYARPFEVLVESRNSTELGPSTELDNPFSKQLKTGTPAFMAIEVQAGLYQFSSDKNPRNKKRRSGGYRFGQEKDDAEYDAPIGSQNPKNMVVHNYLHDLESVWWIANNAILSSVPVDEWDSKFNVDRQRELFLDLFPHATGLCNERYLHFTDEETFGTTMSRVPALRCQPPAEALETIRDLLHTAYVDFYLDMETFRCHRQFRSLYTTLSKYYQEAQAVALERVRSIETVPMSKEQINRRLLRLSNLNAPKVGDKRRVDSVEGKIESVHASKRRSTSPASSDKENTCIPNAS